MRIIFMGSAALACASLDALLADDACEVVAVVTQPDRPKGRNRKLAACPVKAHLGDRAIPVLTPVNVSKSESVEELKKLAPDLVVVVAYGQILRESVLTLAPHGCINVHASLLPKYRGAAPIQWAIANGEKVTGVTTMFLDAGLDSGDMILQVEIPVGEEDTADIMCDKLAPVGAELMLQTVAQIRDGSVKGIPQDEKLATYVPKLTKADGRIDWTLSADEIYNRVRGFNPWPMAWCRAPDDKGRMTEDGKRSVVRIVKARVEDGKGESGEVIDVSDGPLIATGEKAVRLMEVQPEGKRIMSAADYVRGYGVGVGIKMG